MKIWKSGILVLGCTAAMPALAQKTPTPPPSLPMTTMPRGVTSHDTYKPMMKTDVMRPDQDTPRSIEVYNHMLRFGDCAVQASAGKVGHMLAMEPNSDGEKNDLNRLLSRFGGCGPTVMINILTLERGVLSEAAYKSRAQPSISPERISATADDSTAFLDQEKKWNHLRFSGDATMIDATNCLVAVQPTVANEVLYSRHGSPEEKAAMDKLFANAPSCAGPQRPTNLSRSFLRAFIADSLYRLSVSDFREKFLPGVAAPAA